jgi:hypothetical protein
VTLRDLLHSPWSPWNPYFTLTPQNGHFLAITMWHMTTGIWMHKIQFWKTRVWYIKLNQGIVDGLKLSVFAESVSVYHCMLGGVNR